MTSIRDQNKLLRDCFFTLVAGSAAEYVCKLCAEAGGSHKIVSKAGSGYTNFKNHLGSGKHSGVWESRFEQYKARLVSTAETASSDSFAAAAGSSMVHHLVPKYGAKTLFVYGLLETLIDSKTVLPWSFCEDPIFRKNLKCCGGGSAGGGMKATTLKKWASKVVDVMVLKIKALVAPLGIGLIFDGEY